MKVEQTTGLPVLTIDIDRDKAARHGLNVGDVRDAIATAVGGRKAGTLYEGDRRFDMVVRLSETLRTDVDGLASLLIPVPASGAAGTGRIGFIPLSQVATLTCNWGRTRSAAKTASGWWWSAPTMRGRDLGSFVQEAEQVLRGQVPIPAGYWTRWGGQFKQLQSAAERLQVVVPVALLLVMALC